MNRRELLLDFIEWFLNDSTDIFAIIDHPNSTVDEYLEMLEAVEDLDDSN